MRFDINTKDITKDTKIPIHDVGLMIDGDIGTDFNIAPQKRGGGVLDLIMNRQNGNKTWFYMKQNRLDANTQINVELALQEFYEKYKQRGVKIDVKRSINSLNVTVNGVVIDLGA